MSGPALDCFPPKWCYLQVPGCLAPGGPFDFRGAGHTGNRFPNCLITRVAACPFYAFGPHVNSSALFRGQKCAVWLVTPRVTDSALGLVCIGDIAPILRGAIPAEVQFLGVGEWDLEINFSDLGKQRLS